MWGFWLGGLPLLLGTLVVVWVASGPREPADTAARILDERLARGELAVREHREARATLARTRPLAPRTPRRALLAASLGALVVAALVVATAGTGGDGWPGWMRTTHDQLWGARRGGPEPPPPVPGAREVRVVAAELFFEPTDLRARAGETVNVVLDNRGRIFHDLHVEGLDFELAAGGGETDAGALTAPEQPGRYPIRCEVPGHAAAGMRATLTVEARRAS